MAKDLTIKITAVDKASAAVKKVNDSLNRGLAPLRGMKQLGGEIAKNPAIEGVRKLGSAVGTVTKGLGIMSGSMAGLTGLGLLAGVAEMTAQWARLGQTIGNTKTSLGITTRGLTTMRGAAQMAGLSAESMDGGLEAVRQTLQDARWGRNAPVIAMMSRLGIAFRYTKSGSIDAVESLKDISDAMAAQKDVGAKHTIAQAFGVDGLFPLLVKGRQAIEEYQHEIEKLGGVPTDDQIQRANALATAIERIKTTSSGISGNVGDNLGKILTPKLNSTADFLSRHKNGLGNSLTGAGSFFLINPYALLYDWVKNGSPNNSVLRRTGSGQIKPRAIGITNPTAPLGIRSNNPLNMMPGGREAVYSSVEDGLRAAMRNLMGRTYFGGGNDTAAGIISKWSPANARGNSPAKTAAYISAVSADVGTGHLNPNDPATMAKLLSSMIRQENGAGSYDQARMDQAIQHIVLELKNMPPGTVATARTASGNQVPVRIASAMPTMGSP